MNLSKLVYLCVKGTTYFDNYGNFTYDQFMDGNFTNDPDYATAISNVFIPLNEAISRLNDMDKLPYAISEVTPNDNVVDISALNAKEVINFGQVYVDKIYNTAQYYRLEYRPFGTNKYILKAYNRPSIYGSVLCEYKKDIPQFDMSYISYDPEEEQDYDETEATDVDLKEYGITDSMTPYIQEYVKAMLLEQIDPSLANMHRTVAEQYFANIRQVMSSFSQPRIANTYKIGI